MAVTSYVTHMLVSKCKGTFSEIDEYLPTEYGILKWTAVMAVNEWKESSISFSY